MGTLRLMHDGDEKDRKVFTSIDQTEICWLVICVWMYSQKWRDLHFL